MQTSHIIRYFALSTLMPVLLLSYSALVGGMWSVMALIYMTVLAYLLDRFLSVKRTPADPSAVTADANVLSVLLALAHFALLPLAVWALSADHLGVWEKVVSFFAFALFFGQVSNSNAHEMIHRTDATLRRLGTWVYISLLFGHHATAHVRVHHRFAATREDPNSAPWGMGFYGFARRAWIGSFKAGLREENAFRARGNATDVHPYVIYVLGGLACMGLAFVIGGWGGAVIYVLLTSYAATQLLLSDYVQHYGLERTVRADGSYAPIGETHSWNAPHWFTSFVMLNAPRHSDHHAHPMRPYPALELTDTMPQLPRSLPAMAVLALFPPLWKRVMDPRVEAVRAAQDAGLGKDHDHAPA